MGAIRLTRVRMGLLLGGALVAALLAGVFIAARQQAQESSPPGLPPGDSLGVEAPTPVHPVYVASISEGLERPLAVAASPGGDLYVADGACRCIRIFDRQGALRSTLGPALGEQEIEHPVALALDGAGSLYVSDLAGGRILLFRDGAYLGPLALGEIPTSVQAPAGIMLHYGTLYINDLARHQVLVFDPAGRLVQTLGAGPGSKDAQPNRLAYPNFSLLLPDGSLLVADSNNNRLQLFDSYGGDARSWPGPLSVPRGLALDMNGNVHVASTISGRIEVFSAAGRHLGGYSELRGGPGEFGFPTGIAIQGNRFYVADRANGRVQVGAWQQGVTP